MRGFTAYLPRAEFHNQVTSAAQGVGWKLWANVDSSRCFLKLNDIFKWQLFLPPPPPLPLHSNTLWAILLGGWGGGSLYNWWKWKISLSSKNCWFDGDYIIFGFLHNLLVQYMLIKKKPMHCTCQFLWRTKDISKVGGYIEHHPNEYLKNTKVFSTLDNSCNPSPPYLPA